MNRFTGKVALVTGGRSGIGYAIAERLSKEGAKVITAQRGTCNEYPSIEADFGLEDTAQSVVKQVIEETGRLDVLINNAGMMVESRVEDMTFAEWQQTLMVNLSSPFLLIREALPHLRKVKGNIVNVGSVEGLGSNPLHSAYCASKAGLHGLTRAVAVDHGPEGIRCNAVAPGWIDTELNESFIEAQPNPDRFRQSIGGIHPVRHTGTPEDVAALVAYLASAESKFVTGQVYTIDGGRMTQLSLPSG